MKSRPCMVCGVGVVQKPGPGGPRRRCDACEVVWKRVYHRLYRRRLRADAKRVKLEYEKMR